MESRSRSWRVGCGCGCLSLIGFFILIYGLCVGASFVLWEFFDVHEPFLRGPSVIVWGAIVALPVASIFGLVVLFTSRSIAYRRFERMSSAEALKPEAAYSEGGLHGAVATPPFAQSRPGCLMPGIWLGISMLSIFCGLGFVGIMAAASERDGVAAAWIVAAPIGFAIGGTLAAAVIHFAVRTASPLVRTLVPIAVGFLGGIILFALVFIFFTIIWPSL